MTKSLHILSKMLFFPTQAAVRFKAVVLLLLLLFYCLLKLPLFVGVLCLVHILLSSTLCSSSFAIILVGKREVVALLKLPSCDSQCSVAYLTVHGLVGGV